ncbi:sugar nucleotide-binding protein [Verticiella sediminum]|uniref:Sugar nucleotide-binding protein n=1 Tax=Verticiella sediminum TaxID=1247510 RepID=A0A556AET6_9BURK|nr:NAD-dependent epimerase/dehydratase family protein [Verticiella sediminum]TSH91383.1 sugar nucleotide-binding protein [Verticiella sediminum]
MPHHVLIAGCGDLGLRVAHDLLASDPATRVWALRRRPPVPAGPDAAQPRLQWVAADLAEPASLQASLPAHLDQVLYCPTPDARDSAHYRRVFVDGLQHLHALPAARRAQRWVFVSSTAVYGEHAGDWIDEHTACAPLGENGRILLQAEEALRMRVPDAVVLRLAGLYGPGRLGLLGRLHRGEAHAPRQPPHWANRMHIEDAAAAARHLLRLDAPAPVYLGGDDTPLPLHVLYAHLAELVGGPAVPDGPPPRGVGSKRLCNARLKASGFELRWPDARAGYAALVQGNTPPEGVRVSA